MSRPATQIVPVSGSSSRRSSLRKVVLPDPDDPTGKTNSPLVMSRLTLLSAVTDPLYVLVTFSKRIIALFPVSAAAGPSARPAPSRRPPRRPATPPAHSLSSQVQCSVAHAPHLPHQHQLFSGCSP